MKFILGIALTFLVNISFAQQGFRIGAEAGLNTVWITQQDDYGQTGILHVLDYGVAPALTANYNFNDNIGLQMDIIYSLQGAKYQESLKNTLYTRQVNLDYFKVPLYFKYAHSIPDVKNVKFFIMAGPEIGVLQSAVITSDYLTSPYVGDEKYRFESTDFELAGEAGADIYVNDKLNFVLGIRIDYGATNINAADASVPAIASSNATGGLIIGITYLVSKK